MNNLPFPRNKIEDLLEELTPSVRTKETPARIAHAGLSLVRTLLLKNEDYGNSALHPPLLTPDIPQSQALLVRLSDKIGRLSNLTNKKFPEGQFKTTAHFESIDDTIMDIAGYCILYLTTICE